jgi:hypothetical protein
VSLPVMQLKCGTSGNAVPTMLLKCGTQANAVPTLLRKCEAPPLCGGGSVSILVTFSGIELCTYTEPYPSYYWMNIITWPVVFSNSDWAVTNPQIGPQCGTIDEWKWEYLWNPDIGDYEWTRVFKQTLPLFPTFGCYASLGVSYFLVLLRPYYPDLSWGWSIFWSPDISPANWVGTWANTLVECQSDYAHRTKDGSLTLELA